VPARQPIWSGGWEEMCGRVSEWGAGRANAREKRNARRTTKNEELQWRGVV
jgi:hypothetical protein